MKHGAFSQGIVYLIQSIKFDNFCHVSITGTKDTVQPKIGVT
jgi:hypothetical protein